MTATESLLNVVCPLEVVVDLQEQFIAIVQTCLVLLFHNEFFHFFGFDDLPLTFACGPTIIMQLVLIVGIGRLLPYKNVARLLVFSRLSSQLTYPAGPIMLCHYDTEFFDSFIFYDKPKNLLDIFAIVLK